MSVPSRTASTSTESPLARLRCHPVAVAVDPVAGVQLAVDRGVQRHRLGPPRVVVLAEFRLAFVHDRERPDPERDRLAQRLADEQPERVLAEGAVRGDAEPGLYPLAFLVRRQRLQPEALDPAAGRTGPAAGWPGASPWKTTSTVVPRWPPRGWTYCT